MTTYTIDKLSGSTNGRSIYIAGDTSSPGVEIHTAVSGTTDYDEIWLWTESDYLGGIDSSIGSDGFVIEYGGTTATDSIQHSILQEGKKLLIPGLILNNAQVLRGYKLGTVYNIISTTVLSVTGYIIKIRN